MFSHQAAEGNAARIILYGLNDGGKRACCFFKLISRKIFRRTIEPIHVVMLDQSGGSMPSRGGAVPKCYLLIITRDADRGDNKLITHLWVFGRSPINPPIFLAPIVIFPLFAYPCAEL